MNPVKTLSSNHNFGPPASVTDGSIGDLPCEIVEEEDGRYIFSVWQPTPAEREQIAAGYNIRLGVGWIGGFPPVSLGVTHELPLVETQPLAPPGPENREPRPQPDGGRTHG